MAFRIPDWSRIMVFWNRVSCGVGHHGGTVTPQPIGLVHIKSQASRLLAGD